MNLVEKKKKKVAKQEWKKVNLLIFNPVVGVILLFVAPVIDSCRFVCEI